MIIGITGGTGCGKTTALNAIQTLGGVVLDCDAIYHQLLVSDSSLLNAIAARFPGTVEDGTLQRKQLGRIVFSDKNALLDLNRITHSAVKAEVQRRLPPPPKLAAIDAIALFESGLAELCDVTVAITAPEETRIARLMSRDGVSEAYAAARIAAQPSQDCFRSRCDYTLENDGSQPAFHSKCLAFFRQLAIIEKKNTKGETIL